MVNGYQTIRVFESNYSLVFEPPLLSYKDGPDSRYSRGGNVYKSIQDLINGEGIPGSYWRVLWYKLFGRDEFTLRELTIPLGVEALQMSNGMKARVYYGSKSERERKYLSIIDIRNPQEIERLLREAREKWIDTNVLNSLLSQAKIFIEGLK